MVNELVVGDVEVGADVVVGVVADEMVIELLVGDVVVEADVVIGVV